MAATVKLFFEGMSCTWQKGLKTVMIDKKRFMMLPDEWKNKKTLLPRAQTAMKMQQRFYASATKGEMSQLFVSHAVVIENVCTLLHFL